MSSSSVGSPEFDFDGSARGPDIELVEPNPKRRSFLAPLGLGLAAVAVSLFVLAGSPDTDPPTAPEARAVDQCPRARSSMSCFSSSRRSVG